ncbi:MAG: hypothetical protein ACTSP4_09315 [Candidatus Hodarchaeales archaeon]
MDGLEVIKVSYEHYGILVFAQGAWREKDRESLIRKVGQANILDLYRYTLPNNCYLCNQIFEIFSDLQGKNSGIMYVAHAYLEPEAIIEFTELVLSDELVKKFFLFQGGPVKKIRADPKRKHRKYHEVILKDRLKREKYPESVFLELLRENSFQMEVLYEVTRNNYF